MVPSGEPDVASGQSSQSLGEVMASEASHVRELMERLHDDLPDLARAIEVRIRAGKLVEVGSLPESERKERSDAISRALEEAEVAYRKESPKKDEVTRAELTPGERLDVIAEYVDSLANTTVATRQALRSLAGDPEQLTVTFVDPPEVIGDVGAAPPREAEMSSAAAAERVRLWPASEDLAALTQRLEGLNARFAELMAQ